VDDSTGRLSAAITNDPICRACLAQTIGIDGGEVGSILRSRALARYTVARVGRCRHCGHERAVVYAKF